jgi:hypothetical protein
VAFPEDKVYHIGTKSGMFCCPVASYNTKLKDLVGVLTDDNADDLLEEATKKNAEEVKDLIKEYKKTGSVGEAAKATEERTSVVKLHLKLNESEWDVINSAVEEAKKIVESDNTVSALELICMEWMQDHGDAEPAALATLISYIKKVYGVVLTEQQSGDTGTTPKSAAKAQKVKEKVKEPEPEPEAAPAEADTVSEEEVLEELDGIDDLSDLRDFIQKYGLAVEIPRKTKVDVAKDLVKTAIQNIEEPSAVETGENEPPSPPVGKSAVKGGTKKVAVSVEKPVDDSMDADAYDLNKLLGIS